MTDHAARPDTRGVVGVEVAREELLAVRQLLAELQREVDVEEAAAEQAEHAVAALPSSQDVVARSRQLVAEMTALREASWRSTYDAATAEAEARLADAEARATRLAQATSAQLAARLDAAPAPVTAPIPVTAPDPVPTVITSWSAPPAPAPPVVAPAPPAPVVAPVATSVAVAAPAGPPAAEPDPAVDHNEEFWREEAAASASRATATAWTPVELLLPTAALLLILAAVLLLVG